jgi:hypothetical protein
MKASTERLLWIGGLGALVVGGLAAVAFSGKSTPQGGGQGGVNPFPPFPFPPGPLPGGQGGGGVHACDNNFVASIDGPYVAVVCLGGELTLRASLLWVMTTAPDPGVLRVESHPASGYFLRAVGRGKTTIVLANERDAVARSYEVIVP